MGSNSLLSIPSFNMQLLLEGVFCGLWYRLHACASQNVFVEILTAYGFKYPRFQKVARFQNWKHLDGTSSIVKDSGGTGEMNQ